MSKLTKLLQDRINQLEDRKMMIPRYVNQPGGFAGTIKDFSMNDLPKIEEEIEETKAALAGIERWKEIRRK